MNGRAKSVWYALGLLPAVWLGLLVAPAASGGLFEIIRQFPAAMQHPLHIIWCEDSGKAVLFFAAAYGLLVGAALSTRRVKASAWTGSSVKMASLWPVEWAAICAMASSTLSTILTARM